MVNLFKDSITPKVWEPLLYTKESLLYTESLLCVVARTPALCGYAINHFYWNYFVTFESGKQSATITLNLVDRYAQYLQECRKRCNRYFPKFEPFHVTRLVHCLRNAFERIRGEYEDVDKLIASITASVLKDKDRWATFSAINSSRNLSNQMGNLVEGSRILCQNVSARSWDRP